MRKQQREITNHQREISKQQRFQNNAINDAKQISVSHVINDDVEYGFTIAGLILSYIAFADDLALITLEH